MTDDVDNPVVGKCEVFRFQAGGLTLLLHQKPLGDFQLFRLRIAFQPQNLHAILKRLRNGVDNVGRGDEEHLREVKFDVQIMIHEGAILFRIKDFQQRRGGIAAEIHAHLIHFIQQEDGVDGPRFFHHLDDLAGQSADVGPAMAADFRFVPNATQERGERTSAP